MTNILTTKMIAQGVRKERTVKKCKGAIKTLMKTKVSRKMYFSFVFMISSYIFRNLMS